MASVKGKIFLDFETRSEESIENGAASYAADTSTEIILAQYAIEGGEVVVIDMFDEWPECQKKFEPLFQAISDGLLVYAHNVLFEMFIIRYCGWRVDWPKMKLEQFRDSMHLATRAGLPSSLDGASKALNIQNKLEEGKQLIKMFCIPNNPDGIAIGDDAEFYGPDNYPEQWEQFKEYARVDVEVCREIVRQLPEFQESETRDIQADLRANMRGVNVDVPSARIIYDRILEEQKSFNDRAAELTRGVITKMTQVQRLKKWVQEHVSPEVPGCAAEYITDMLDGKYGPLDDVTEELLVMRQHSGKSSTGKFARFVYAQVDGSLMGMIISFGTHTGRVISRLVNLANLPKPSVKYESIHELIEDLTKKSVSEVNEKYGSYLKAASTAIRGLLKARPGKVYCVADYSSIEARLVFWAADCEAGLEQYRKKIDAYIVMAETIFDTTYDRVTDDERWVGKGVILGAGYGLGWKGFQNQCANYGRDLPDELCQEAISSYRTDYPEVVSAWNQCWVAAKKAIQTKGKVFEALNGRLKFKYFTTKSGVGFLLMRLPSGRFISYPGAKLAMKMAPWGENTEIIKFRKVKNGKYLHESMYGAKIFQNAIQSIARDLMYNGVHNSIEGGFEYQFQVYDELVSEIDVEKANIKLFEQLLCITPEWGKDIPLEAEGKIITRYQKI